MVTTRIAPLSWISVARRHPQRAAGSEPDDRHGDQAGDQHERPSGGQPVEAEREAGQRGPVGIAHIEPRPLEARVVHGDPASCALTAGSCAIENTARMTRYGAYARRMSPGESLVVVVATRAGGATSGSAGVQTRRSATIAARLDDRRHDVRQLDRDVVRARELGERRTRIHRQRDRPCLPDPAPAVDDAEEDERQRSAPATASGGRPSRRARPRSSPVTSDRVMIGIASAPNGTAAVFPSEGDRGRLDRLEAERDHHRRGDRHRGAEAGERLQQRAEAEGDQHRLDALILRRPSRSIAAGPRSARSRRSCCRPRSPRRRST